jgi:type I restriction enzyme R subunit
MEKQVIRRRKLPHWDVPGAPYFVTTCLEGSIPAQGLVDLARYRDEVQRWPRPNEMKEEAWRIQCWKQVFVRLEHWLDEQPAIRHLEDPVLTKEVVESMVHFAGERYDLLAYVVMPSHLHWLFRPLDSWVETFAGDPRTPRQRIVYSMNRFTATKCNRLLKRNGRFWQKECYDHWVRDTEELERIIRYIEENPVKAGLVASPEEWRFSSAWLRKQTGTEWGGPLAVGYRSNGDKIKKTPLE